MGEHDWEALGREAVELGMPCRGGLTWLGDEELRYRQIDVVHDGWCYGAIPDFRDRLTALACIAWVEDEWRAIWPGGDVEAQFYSDGRAQIVIWTGAAEDSERRCFYEPTLPHAAIEAVKAMKGAE